LIIFQNIVLAVVGNAHDAARRRELGPSITCTFSNLLIFYLFFGIFFTGFAIASLCPFDRQLGLGAWYNNVSKKAAEAMLMLHKKIYMSNLMRTYCVFVLHGDIMSRLAARFVDSVSNEMSVMLTGKLFNLPIGYHVNLDLDVFLLMPAIKNIKKNGSLSADFFQNAHKEQNGGSVNAVSSRFIETSVVSCECNENKNTLVVEINNVSSANNKVNKVSMSILARGERYQMPMKAQAAIEVPEAAIDIFNVILSKSKLKDLLIHVMQEQKQEQEQEQTPPRCLTNSYQSADTDKAALEIYEAYTTSLVDQISLFNNYVAEKKKNLFESVDSFVDDAQHAADAYSGGYRNAVALQRFDKMFKSMRLDDKSGKHSNNPASASSNSAT